MEFKTTYNFSEFEGEIAKAWNEAGKFTRV